MKASDFSAATDALRRCRDGHKRLSECKTAQQFSDAWSDFLIAQQRVFTKLAAGSKGGKSALWFGKVNSVRTSDELLAYIHQARHSDEHGLAKVADPRDPAIAVNAKNRGEPLHIKKLVIRNGRIEEFSGENMQIDFSPADATVLPVTNRGVTYAIPTSHMGSTWNSSSALDIAGAALKYIEGVIDEGRKFVSP